MPQSSLTPLWGFLAALPVAVGAWLLVTGLLSTLSGWPTLAATFPGGPVPPGNRLRGQVLGLGPVRENNVTIVVPTTQGLYLYAVVLFRVRRRPVLVPWPKVRYLESRQLLWARWHVLDLGGVTTLRVRPDLLPVLRSHGVAVPSEALPPPRSQ